VLAPRPAAPHPKPPASTPSARPIDAAKPSEGASALADGVELIERGDYGAAAERLGAFRQSHPGDVRAQDAAFLAILALERAGRHPAAVAAARDYLASYPQGYRRAEAVAIVAAP
jgi:outer membrane protein assembly factor BamD (BamD/ComL family)